MNVFANVPQTQWNNASLNVGARNSQGGLDWAAGDVITATLLERKGDTATLRTKEELVFQTAGQVRGEVGDTLTFEVVKNGKDGFTLKQLDPSEEEAVSRPRGNADITAEIREVNRTIEKVGEEDRQRTEDYQETQRKTSRALARIQRAQQTLFGGDSKSVAAVLSESGLSLGKVSFAQLSRVMQEADRRPHQKMTSAEQQAVSQFSYTRPADAPLISQALYRHGSPINEKNIQTLENAWEKFPTRLDDRATAKLVADDADLTVENLYVSRYSAPGRGAVAPKGTVDWEALAGEVQKHFQREGIDENRDNLNTARFLLENDLPLDKTTLEKTFFLQNLSKNISKKDFYEKAAESIARGRSITSLPLMEIAGAEHARLERETANQNRVERIATLTAQGLTEAEQTALFKTLADTPGIPWDERITARRALTEAQLKFTAEAAARLSGGDISISTEPLREALNFLNRREQEEYARYLRMAGTDDSAAPVSQMTTLFDSLTDLKPLTVNVHADILQGRTANTITGVHASLLAARAKDGYETFATVPSARYGDSFAQVRNMFTPLLERIGVAPTAENLKAAFILSKNQMDVDAENIMAVKEMDAKINTVANHLQPMIAAQMIKDGYHPLEMPLEQIINYIKQYKETLGEDGSDKIARYIREMDDDKTIDADTRKRMIAVYRMLHIIQKDGAAALGLAARQAENTNQHKGTRPSAQQEEGETPLTLGGLMSLSQYYEKQHRTGSVLDRSIDEAFGMLERLSSQEQSIRDILRTGQGTSDVLRQGQSASDILYRPLTYTDLITDAAIDTADPKNLSSLLAKFGENLPLEDIPDLMVSQSNETNMPATLARMQSLLNYSPGLITYLQHRNIPATEGTLRALEKLTHSPRSLTKSLDALDKDTLLQLSQILPDTRLTALREGKSPAQLLAQARAALEDSAVLAETAEDAERAVNARDLLALRNALNEDGGFNLPIRMNGQTANLSLFVLNEQAMLEDGARILLSLDTQTLGTVQGYFTLNDGAINLNLTADTTDALSQLQARQESLTVILAEEGITVENIAFTLSERHEGNLHASEAVREGDKILRTANREGKTGAASTAQKTESKLSEYEYKV